MACRQSMSPSSSTKRMEVTRPTSCEERLIESWRTAEVLEKWNETSGRRGSIPAQSASLQIRHHRSQLRDPAVIGTGRADHPAVAPTLLRNGDEVMEEVSARTPEG